MPGAEGKVHVGYQAHTKGLERRERTHVRDLARIPQATKQIVFVQQSPKRKPYWNSSY